MGVCSCNLTTNIHRGNALIQVVSKDNGNNAEKDDEKNNEIYETRRTLGKGASSQVLEVADSKGNVYAMKILRKGKHGSKTFFEDEVYVLKQLHHPNIVKFVRAWEDDAYRILTVLCSGGELYGRLKLGSFSEKAAAQLTAQMLEAVKFCHSNNIVHRDLKPENFMFSDEDSGSPLKLIDFGCAVMVDDHQIVRDVAGTAWYVAPECLVPRRRTGKLWKCSDMWSIGVIVYLFVCGYPPFNGSTQEAIFNKIRKGHFSFPSKTEFGFKFSDAVQEFIRSLLNPVPEKRLTAEEASENLWVKGITAAEIPIPQHVLDRLFDFRQNCRLKKAVARAMQNCMTERDKEELKQVFNRFDNDQNERLTPDEINQLMAFIGKNEKDGERFMNNADDNQDGIITIDEMKVAYTMGTMATGECVNQKGLQPFSIIDTDGNGFVDINEIQQLCKGITRKEATEMVEEVDGDSDGRVNFEEWIKAMGEYQPKKGMTNSDTRIGV